MHQIVAMLRHAIIAPLQVLPNLVDQSDAKSIRPDQGRLYALDLARFLAMLFMMQGHVLDALVSAPLLDVNTFPWSLWHSIRGFTAPVFLMVSGTVHAFANKRADNGYVFTSVLERRIRWGITLIGIGYLLTFPASRVWDLPTVPPQGWASALAVNILQLTGAAMLALVAIMYTTRSVRQLGFRTLVAALVILAATPAVQTILGGSQIQHLGLPTWFVAYLTTSTGSIFPFFPFAAYMFLGVTIGSYLHSVPATERNRHIQRYGWRVGGVLVAIALLMHYAGTAAGIDISHLDSPTSTILFARRVGVALIVFSVSAWLLQRTWKFRNIYSMFGRRSLYIYVIHLVILFGTPWMNGIARTRFRTMSLEQGALMALLVITSTLILAWGIDSSMKRLNTPTSKKLLATGSVLILGWLLLL